MGISGTTVCAAAGREKECSSGHDKLRNSSLRYNPLKKHMKYLMCVQAPTKTMVPEAGLQVGIRGLLVDGEQTFRWNIAHIETTLEP